MNVSMDDLTKEGRDKLERDFQAVDRRDGGKTSRVDFSLGWMALAVRYGHWILFTADAYTRLRGGR